MSPLTQATPAASDKTTHFGFKTVPEAEKESLGELDLPFLPSFASSLSLAPSFLPLFLPSSSSPSFSFSQVRGVFSSVASSYDVMNDAMSLGIHRLWKDSFVSILDPGGRGKEGWKCLDVAGGTGDIAERILDHARLKHADRDVSVIVLDINQEMLKEGEKRFRKTMYHGGELTFFDLLPFASSSLPLTFVHTETDRLPPHFAHHSCSNPTSGPQVSFIHGNAQALPSTIPSSSIDLYTIAFGIRNCTDIPAVLEEAYRVLKPGGTFACMEFGKVTNPLFARFVPFVSPLFASSVVSSL